MDAKENIMASRRGFIYTLSGLLSGLLIASPTPLMAMKRRIKNLLGSLEIEILEKSRPIRSPAITANSYGDKTTLSKKVKGKTHQICIMNQTGKTIWETCNGKNTPQDISELVFQKYLVSSHQAYVDCLAFLAWLKTMGAVII